MFNAVYCPHSTHNATRRKRLLAVFDKNSLFLYCPDLDCTRERGGTWTKVDIYNMGKRVDLSNTTVKVSEMKKGYHFDLDKNTPIVMELSDG